MGSRLGQPKTEQHRQRLSESHVPGRFTDEHSRTCKDCGQTRPLGTFPPSKRGFQGRRWDCRDCYRAKSRQWGNATYARWRQSVLKSLGGSCSRCGIDDDRVLAIDHVEGGGRQHRMNGASGAQYLRNLSRDIENGSEAYRLLCHNCNWIVYKAED